MCAAVQSQSQFRLPSKSSEEAQELEDTSASAAAPVHYRYRPNSYEYEEEEEQPQQYQKRPVQQTSQSKQQLKVAAKKKQYEEELEQELEEPDRLALMLEKSSFQCHDRVTGYYADDTVGCEVFHYCTENQKHSWVCPEGFTFHQVHLICMPPSHENDCQDSAKYHVVNDYLYKPLNMEEHQRKPNVSIRYAERYFPENIYYDDRRYYRNQDYYEPEPKAPVRQQVRQSSSLTLSCVSFFPVHCALYFPIILP